MNDISTDVPEGVTALLTLFKEQLSDVVFPDVSLEVIEGLIAGLDAKGRAVEDARRLVESAQEELSLAHEELQQRCVKALAYARIYAEGNEGLQEQLSGIQFGKQVRVAKKTVSRAKKEVAAQSVVSEVADDVPAVDEVTSN